MGRIGCMMVLLAGLVPAAVGQEGLTEMSGFRVPEYDAKGNKRSEITGDFAKMTGKGAVDITNLKIEFYEKGEVSAKVTSPQCTYDQKREIAYSDEQVRMSRENMQVTGTGFVWYRTNGIFQILSEAKVVLKNVSKHVDAEKLP